ncbi:MAG: 3-deoxy-D-manno-octulosonic acid transferase [Flavobacteriaceae bacterium]|nr:MAG: 3-deoxy-D-manno-octulosonic acid transferase [Flavobacteriaceae bacterium]
MYFIYTCLIHITWFVLKIIALFNPKIKLFVKGRKGTFSTLENKISKNDAIIWVHVASLGEFEQGLPVMEQLKLDYPTYKIVVTFFSPSGYEVKKNTEIAHLVTYLPLDTKSNVIQFLNQTHPKLAIFVKYEIWPNYLKELQHRNIPTLLISSIFRKEQIFFKWYGSFMRKTLSKFSFFFVQDENSEKLLNSIDFNNVSVSGDTRFDRVYKILEQDNFLAFMSQFKQDKQCFVAGSTWPADEAILVDHINASSNQMQYVIAPHNIKKNHIQELKKNITKKTVLYSEIKNINCTDFEVVIIDTIGLLTKIYSYADIAYVGGGFATGLHNTLEPAVFGIPVLIGPNYKGFKEAEDLVSQKGALCVTTKTEFNTIMNQLTSNIEFRTKTGKINAQYVLKNKGASIQIVAYIRTLL